MNQLTVRELLTLCQQEVAKGNGDKHIVICDDNEHNGYHGLFLGFVEYTDDYKDEVYDTCYSSEEDTIILG